MADRGEQDLGPVLGEHPPQPAGLVVDADLSDARQCDRRSISIRGPRPLGGCGPRTVAFLVAATADGTEVTRISDAPKALAAGMKQQRRLSTFLFCYHPYEGKDAAVSIVGEGNPLRLGFFGSVPFVVVLALAGCGAETAEDKDAPVPIHPLGSSVKVGKSSSSWGSDNFEGTVTALSPPSVFKKSTGEQFLVFDVEARATKGAIPTGSWQVQTLNAVPKPNLPISEKGIGTPPLGPEVNDFAKGFVTFEVPEESKPTRLQLLDYPGSGEPLAQWSLDELPEPQPYP
ncbi:hypothetical protein KL864_31095 [Mycolicibacterium goodii]|uniref:hypothetical protein n=1 Tax=Mycolicibacterium goodii TaxID=134601 RepID=UPI001BDD27DB|nr:hypothetical protein [Mycolicibacterium goodii]MBU8820329.1 hypothetical protein [Mycolicibacterium goodii]